MTPKVQEFARKLHVALEAEHWGDIEPEVFQNIAEGRDGLSEPEEGFHANKLDQEEMGNAVQSMAAILEKIL